MGKDSQELICSFSVSLLPLTEEGTWNVPQVLTIVKPEDKSWLVMGKLLGIFHYLGKF